MALPGDDLVPAPMVPTTHAVTINAPPQRVWPWLVQTGQGRAGFYSDSRFEDRSVDWYYRRLSRKQAGKEAVGYRVAASDRIVPEWQNPRVGDIIADGPPGTAYYVVRQAEPGKSWVVFTDTHLRYLVPARLRDNSRLGIFGELSDSCLLTEPEPGTTRVVRRMRLRCGPWLFRAYVVPIVLVWGEAVTARNLLRGVKRRAESGQPRRLVGGVPDRSMLHARSAGVSRTQHHPRHGGRVPAGLQARIVQRLLALNAAIWHNWRIGTPVKRSHAARIAACIHASHGGSRNWPCRRQAPPRDARALRSGSAGRRPP